MANHVVRKSSYISDTSRISEDEKAEFFSSMIKELRTLAAKADYCSLSLLMDSALEELRREHRTKLIN